MTARPSVFALLLTIPLLALAPRAARAGDPPAPAPRARSATLSIEVSEVGKERRAAAQFTVAVRYDGKAHVEVDSGPAHFKLGLFLDGRGPLPVLDLELERSDRTPEGNLGLRLSTAMTPGQRAVLATIVRADGSSVEVAGTLR